jgi:small subunit ribosomal protein S20
MMNEPLPGNRRKADRPGIDRPPGRSPPHYLSDRRGGGRPFLLVFILYKPVNIRYIRLVLIARKPYRMPIIKSAMKRARQQVKRRSHNLQVKALVKKDTRLFTDAVAAGDAKAVAEAFKVAQSEIDRAVKKGTIHKNTAARRKSRMAAVMSAAAKPVEKAEKPKAKATAPKKAATKKAAAKKPAAKKTTK